MSIAIPPQNRSREARLGHVCRVVRARDRTWERSSHNRKCRRAYEAGHQAFELLDRAIISAAATASAATYASNDSRDPCEARIRNWAVALALHAAEHYAALEWSLLQAQALELAGRPLEAQAIFVRRGRGQITVAQPNAPPAVGLTTRERQVTELVVAGLANEKIATRLSLSVKTVEAHLTRIFTRLGLRSRVQLANDVANAMRNPGT
jgi:DNA-binding NarL/FixJ family response regulator